MPNTRPLVSVACICERVLEEKDGVLSAIRLVDLFFVEKADDANVVPTGQPVGPKSMTAISATAFVVLKSGDLKGSFEVYVKLRTPSGKTVELPQKWPAEFLGGEQGVSLVMTFFLPVGEFGLFWFDVYWMNEVLTSIPLKLVLGSKPAPDATAAPLTPHS